MGKFLVLFFYLSTALLFASTEQGLPFPEALNFIKNSDSVYLSYIPPRINYTEERRSQLKRATEDQKAILKALFSNSENYFRGTWSVVEGPAADHLYIEFRKGNEKLTITTSAPLDGSFRGKRITGLLHTVDGAKTLQSIKQKLSEEQTK